jgi:hypothetical protein
VDIWLAATCAGSRRLIAGRFECQIDQMNPARGPHTTTCGGGLWLPFSFSLLHGGLFCVCGRMPFDKVRAGRARTALSNTRGPRRDDLKE